MNPYKVGEVYQFEGKFYVYRGGDPEVRANWEEAAAPGGAPRDPGNGALRAIENGMTLGWGPELQGLAAAAPPSMFTRPDDPRFDRTTEDRRRISRERRQEATEELQGFREEHPVLSTGLEVGGGILSALPFGVAGASAVGAQGLRKAATSAAGAGALSGGVAGAGEADGNRLLGSVLGGAAGAIGGGLLGMGAHYLRKPAARAARKLADAIGIGGEAQIAREAAQGLPEQRLLDLNTRTQRLGETAGTYPGEAVDAMRDELTARSAAEADRIAEVLAQRSGISPENAVATQRQLIEQMKQGSQELYAEAYQHSVPSSAVADVLELPDFRAAYERGRRIAEVEGVVIPPLGDKLPERLPVQAIDYMKRGLDAVIEAGGSSERSLSRTEARALRVRLRGALQQVDELVPPYKAARAQFAGDAALEGAFTEGMEEFLRSDPRAIRSLLAEMTPSERELYRRGAMDALRMKMESVSDGRSVAQAVFGNRLMRQRVELLFDNPIEAKLFMAGLERFKQMRLSEILVNKGSQTARRLAGQADFEDGNPADLVGAVFSPISTAEQVTRRAAGRATTGPAVANELAPMLMRPMGDPGLQDVARQILQGEGRRRGAMSLLGALGGGVAGRGAGAGLFDGGSFQP